MNGTTRNQMAARKRRARATPAVAPMTHAIRTALLASVAALALSTPAWAAAHRQSAPAVSCDVVCKDAWVLVGNETLPPPVDLTWVQDAHVPSSVSPGGAFIDGVSFALNPSLLAEITTPIDVHSAYGDATGYYAGCGDNTIINTSSIHASGYASATGVRVWGDYTRVENSGSIVAEAASSHGYVPVVGVRASGYDARVYNDAGGLISASSSTDAQSGWARARGVYATGYFNGVSVDNHGEIDAYAHADNGRAESFGLYAFGYGSATTVTNAGDINASAVSANGAAYARGINAIGYGWGDHDSVVDNSGTIVAQADAIHAYAFGAINLTRQHDGSSYFSNEGDIQALASGNTALATGVMNMTLRYGDANASNGGAITAVANGVYGGSATGMYNYAEIYNANLNNSGTVSASASGDLALAVGVLNNSVIYGNAVTTSSGDISAHADGDGLARAVGMVSQAEHAAYLYNYGTVEASAYAESGSALAAGLYALSYQAAIVHNGGSVSAHAESTRGNATAYGVFAFGGQSGSGLLINDGDISAVAVVGDGDGESGGMAYAVAAKVMADVASIFNDTQMTSSATAGNAGTAMATGAHAYGLYSAVNNYGDITAYAQAGDTGSVAQAIGARSYGFLGSTLNNSGTIEAEAVVLAGDAAAIGSYSLGMRYSAYTTNSGAISAQAMGDSATANGIINASAYLGDAITINSGSISAVATGGVAEYGAAEATATGVYNLALIYHSEVDNSGSISATALAMADIGGTDGFLQAKAIGAEAVGFYGYGDTVIRNTGVIHAAAMTSQGYASAWGAVAQTSGLYGGTAIISNDGAVSAYAYADVGVANAIGVYAFNQRADIDVVNTGDISATGHSERGIVNVSVNYAYATGLKAASYYGTVSITNEGSISALASAEGAITGARGIQAGGANISIYNAAGASINATGEVDLFGGGFATGIEANGIYSISIVNDGDIGVYGHAHALTEGENGFYGAAKAMGIYAAAGMQGNVAVTNNGDISAVALAEDSVSFFQGGAGATGVNAYAKYDATITNNGDITASAQAEFGISAAYGVIGHGKYSTSVVNAAGAKIVAQAVSGTLDGDNYGGRAVSFGTHVFGNGMDHGSVYNAGSIISSATATAQAASPSPSFASAWGASIGAYSNVHAGTIVNIGDIEASARADFGSATAYGSYILSGPSAVTSNTGTILASADAVGGMAWSVGSFSHANEQQYYVPCHVEQGEYGPYNVCDYSNPHWITIGGDASLANQGTIASLAHAAGGVGSSYGVVMLGGVSASISNSGQISAVAEANNALAVGALANAFYGEASMTNSGSISALARGDIASAMGVEVLGLYGTQMDNSGTIVARAYGADATARAVVMASSGTNVLNNSGSIAAFGDGARIAVDAGSAGITQITNAGTLVGAVLTGAGEDGLSNATGALWLALGSSHFGDGNDSIGNAGTIVMQNAIIDLGAGGGEGFTAAPLSNNGNSFANTGLIVVAGSSNVIDMGGEIAFLNNGTIDFLDGHADDMLSITGNFDGIGNLRFDADLAGRVADQLQVGGDVTGSAAQAVRVSLTGVPIAADEKIALVHAGGALTGNFSLAGVQYAPTQFMAQTFGLSRAANTLWLESTVTGLEDAGALAASVASGAAALLDSQVGTFRQRLGVNPYGDTGAVLSAFVRLYNDQGDMRPGHLAGNFGQGGHFNYNQANWGREVGVNANLSGNFHAGIVLGNGDTRQRLTEGGAGENRMSGMTVGGYATWYVPGGLYFDFSARQMAVDIHSTSVIGTLTSRAHTSAVSLESGYALQWGGVNWVPQVQYTRSRVTDIRKFSGTQMEFVAQGGTFSRGRLGLELNKTFQWGDVRWTPYGSLNVVRDIEGKSSYAVGNFFGSTDIRGTSTLAEMGVGVQKGGFGFTAGVNWTDGGAYKRIVGAQANLRFAW